jgi:hypothetical protein
MAWLQHTWYWLRDWLTYILPALVNVVLVLLGLILSLPKLAEAIENTPKHRKLLAAVCLFAGLVGFIFDVGQRRSSDRQNKQLLTDEGIALRNTNDLVQKTTNLVTATSNMVIRMGWLEPQIRAINEHLETIDTKIVAAKKQNNPKLVAKLQSQKESDLSTLLALAPGIVGEMRTWFDNWDSSDRRIESTYEKARNDNFATMTPEEFTRKIYEPFQQQRLELNRDYTSQVLPLMTSANYLRGELLRKLPNYQQTEEDRKMADLFARVLTGTSMDWEEMKLATDYMDALVRRFSIAAPPVGLTAVTQ